MRVGQSSLGGRYPSGIFPIPATPPFGPSGLAQEILQGFLGPNHPIQVSIVSRKDLGGVAFRILLEDEQRRNGLPEILLQGAFGPEDRALRGGGTGHGGIVGHEAGRLLAAVLSLDGDPLFLQLLAELEGLRIIARELRPRRLLTAVVELYLHPNHLRSARIAHVPGTSTSRALRRNARPYPHRDRRGRFYSKGKP